LGVPDDGLEVPPLVRLDEDGAPKPTREWPEQLLVSEVDGPESLEVALRPHVGWTVDLALDEPGARGRMSLRAAVLGVRDHRPDMPEESVAVTDLAALLAVELGYLEAGPGHRRLRRCAPTPRARDDIDRSDPGEATTACAGWLRWCGFTDAAVVRRGSRRYAVEATHLAVHVHAAATPAGLGVIQRTQGRASVAGTRGVVVSATGFSRDAVGWAEVAEVALFDLTEWGLLRPCSSVAAALHPDPGEVPPPLCANPSCLQMGCMLEDELCPDERGRAWADASHAIWRE
jgi:hypothetical protein